HTHTRRKRAAEVIPVSPTGFQHLRPTTGDAWCHRSAQRKRPGDSAPKDTAAICEPTRPNDSNLPKPPSHQMWETLSYVGAGGGGAAPGAETCPGSRELPTRGPVGTTARPRPKRSMRFRGPRDRAKTGSDVKIPWLPAAPSL